MRIACKFQVDWSSCLLETIHTHADDGLKTNVLVSGNLKKSRSDEIRIFHIATDHNICLLKRKKR